MYPVLLPIYGPFAIQAYGVAMALGFFIFLRLIERDATRLKMISTELLYTIMMQGVCVALLGARILHIVENWQEYTSWIFFFFVWNGGFAVVGGVVALVIYAAWVSRRYPISLLPFVDLCALYAPVAHMCGRTGCFLAGCCYGSSTSVMWAVVYTNPQCHAPLGIPLHATQLYSVVCFVVIFLLLRLSLKHFSLGEGKITLLYIILFSLERFFIDFLRGDRIMNMGVLPLSMDQCGAILVFVGALIAFGKIFWAYRWEGSS
jgi:phosphatidylglycerol---prolipoprotein diacylglyceryl transferase